MFSESRPKTDGLSGVGVDELAFPASPLFDLDAVVDMTDEVRRVMKTLRRTDVVTSIVDFRMIWRKCFGTFFFVSNSSFAPQRKLH
jgi:hypothetical protein